MCEECQQKSEQIWAEIRDLMNYKRKVNGPLSEMIKQRVEEARVVFEEENLDDEMLVAITDLVRVEMIAQRCAFIARYTMGPHHGEMPSQILGGWAGSALQIEQQAFQQALQSIQVIPFNGLIDMLFGQEEEVEDE